MSFDFSSIKQKPNNWFSTNINYDGYGIAEFQDPKGQVRGHTYISFKETGEFKIEMQVEDWNSEQILPLGLPQLLSRDKPMEINGTFRLGFPPLRYNTCLKLSVNINGGEFVSLNMYYFSLSFDSKISTNEWNKISFSSTRSWFDTTNPNPAKYWAIPLANFISNFSTYEPKLAHHPLRIYPDALIPNDLADEDKASANLKSTQKSRLIVFEYNGDLGFIEKLPDYDERIEKLKNRQIPSAITALLIGSIGSNLYNPIEELDKWFPYFLIELLELSIGNQLEFPWIEIRDEQGCLIRRIHNVMKPPLYMEGIKAIDEIYCKGGIGRLLTIAQQSPHINQSFFRVALSHTILGGRYEQTIEDKLDHLCRALDTLCEYFGFKNQNLLSLSNNQDQQTIHYEIQKVSKVIDTISKSLLENGDFAQSRYLQTIIGRLNNATNKDRKFGLAVCDLLNKFDLPYPRLN